MSEGDTAHVRVRRDATWQQIADGLVVSSDGTVRLRIVERTDGMFDIVEQTATGTTVTVSWANRWTDVEWELRRLQERNTPAEIASGVEMEHGNRVPPEECILKNDVTEETEQATLIPDGGADKGAIERNSRGGSVNSDVSYFRGSDYVIRFPARRGVTCHQCGSGEVWQPMQTMDMPIIFSCLRCGLSAPAGRFNRFIHPGESR